MVNVSVSLRSIIHSYARYCVVGGHVHSDVSVSLRSIIHSYLIAEIEHIMAKAKVGFRLLTEYHSFL